MAPLEFLCTQSSTWNFLVLELIFMSVKTRPAENISSYPSQDQLGCTGELLGTQPFSTLFSGFNFAENTVVSLDITSC